MSMEARSKRNVRNGSHGPALSVFWKQFLGKSDRFRVLSVRLYYSAGCVSVGGALVDSSVKTQG